MNIFKKLFNSSFSGHQKVIDSRSRRFTLETLEPRIAFDASGLEGPTLEPTAVTSYIYDRGSLAPKCLSPDMMRPQRDQNFIITHIPEGVTVEKWDNVSNQWCNVSAAPSTSNPRELHRALSLRNIRPDDEYRVTGTPDKGSPIDPFQAVWADGSKVDYYVLTGVLGNTVPNGGCGTMPPSVLPVDPRQRCPPTILQLHPSPSTGEPLLSNTLDTDTFVGEDSAESKNDFESISVIDANLTNTDRAFLQLNQTNLVGTDSDNTELTEVDSNPATQTSTELTKTEQAFVDLSLMNLVSTDLTEPDDLTNYNFANILPNALDPAASGWASISD